MRTIRSATPSRSAKPSPVLPRRPLRKSKTLRLIQPNAGIAAWYRRQLRELLAAMHTSMSLHIVAAYKNTDFVIGFSHDSVPAQDDALAQDDASAVITMKRAMMAALKKAGFTVKFQPTKSSIDAYRLVLAEQVNLIKSIPQQYLKDVETQVWGAVMQGGATAELSAGLQKKYGIAYRRAAFIATDQQSKAKAIMENVR